MSGLGHIWMDELTPEREAEVTVPTLDDMFGSSVQDLKELRSVQVDVLRQCIERARYAETRVRELIASNRWLEDELVKARSRQ
jgi:hypothetical protein